MTRENVFRAKATRVSRFKRHLLSQRPCREGPRWMGERNYPAAFLVQCKKQPKSEEIAPAPGQGAPSRGHTPRTSGGSRGGATRGGQARGPRRLCLKEPSIQPVSHVETGRFWRVKKNSVVPIFRRKNTRGSPCPVRSASKIRMVGGLHRGCRTRSCGRLTVFLAKIKRNWAVP